MNCTEIIYAIGDGATEFFKILPPIGRMVNIVFIIIGSIGTLYWLNYMSRHPEKYPENI